MHQESNLVISEKLYRAVNEIHKMTNESVNTIIKEAIKFYLWAKTEIITGNLASSQNLTFSDQTEENFFCGLYYYTNADAEKLKIMTPSSNIKRN